MTITIEKLKSRSLFLDRILIFQSIVMSESIRKIITKRKYRRKMISHSWLLRKRIKRNLSQLKIKSNSSQSIIIKIRIIYNKRKRRKNLLSKSNKILIWLKSLICSIQKVHFQAKNSHSNTMKLNKIMRKKQLIGGMKIGQL